MTASHSKPSKFAEAENRCTHRQKEILEIQHFYQKCNILNYTCVYMYSFSSENERSKGIFKSVKTYKHADN